MTNKFKKTFFAAAFAALAGTLAFTGCDDKKAAAAAPKGPAEVAVTIETVNFSEHQMVQELPGRIDAVRLADVSARVTGILLERKFEEGAKVEKDQVLFQIDPAPLQAARDAAAAQVEVAKANLNGAEITFKRFSELLPTGGVSRQNYDDAMIAVDTAKAALLAAEAQLKSAEINLGYATVTAPISGIIGAALVTEGGMVSGNALTKMAVIQQMDPINFDFTRSATSFLELRKAIAAGTVEKIDENTVPVQLVLEDGTVYEHAGKLKFSEVTVDKSTGMYTLRAEFPNPDNLLLPGMFARATLLEGVNKQAILVPQKAVALGTAGKATIFTVGENDMVIPRPITIGKMADGNWTVTDGLKPGDRIVTDGMIAIGMALQQGAGVKAIPATKNAPEAEAPAETPAEAAPAEAPAETPAEAAPAEAQQ